MRLGAAERSQLGAGSWGGVGGCSQSGAEGGARNFLSLKVIKVGAGGGVGRGLRVGGEGHQWGGGAAGRE